MKLFNKINNFIKSITIKNPAKKEIVIFDCAGSEIIKRMILYDIDCTIFYVRGEKYYLTLSIIYQILKSIKLIDYAYISKNKYKFKTILKEIFIIYCYSCICYIKPKIVVTFVDNSYWFQMVNRMYDHNAVFYAIQNGCRLKYNVTKWLPEAPDPGRIIFINNFICFGNYEIKLYNKYNHDIRCFIPVGSIRGSYYKNELALKENKIKYDICLVSEWDKLIFERDMYPEIKNGIIILIKYLSRYIEEYKVSLCVATRSNDKAETKYYKKWFGEKVKIIDYDMEKMSTYHAMDESSVIVTFYSTAAVEAFGWGKKVLFSNFSGDDNYDLPHKGIWTINQNSYNLFKNKINYLFRIKEDDYNNETGQCAKYLMNYNPQLPAHLFIRNMLMKKLNSLLL